MPGASSRDHFKRASGMCGVRGGVWAFGLSSRCAQEPGVAAGSQLTEGRSGPITVIDRRVAGTGPDLICCRLPLHYGTHRRTCQPGVCGRCGPPQKKSRPLFATDKSRETNPKTMRGRGA